MKTVTILKGLPASGKSTWAREQVLTKPGSVKRVNKDELRQMLDAGHWSKGNEKFVLDMRNNIICNALLDGKHVIVDDTNLDPKHEKSIRELVKGQGIQIIINDDFLNVPIEECIKRDALRGDKSVGEKVIREMAQRYLKPRSLDTILVQSKNLPSAYIVDIDGTLSKLNGRNPFDYTCVENDSPNLDVIGMVKNLYELGYEIVICSGRPETCKVATQNWLIKHKIPFSDIHMRKEGDSRADDIIKREFLDKIIEKYYVLGVFDDRLRVCRMWHRVGLTLFRVGDPDADF